MCQALTVKKSRHTPHCHAEILLSHSAVHTALHSAVHTVHTALQSTVHTALHSAVRTVHIALHSMVHTALHSALHTVHTALHSTVHTVHTALYWTALNCTDMHWAALSCKQFTIGHQTVHYFVQNSLPWNVYSTKLYNVLNHIGLILNINCTFQLFPNNIFP